MKRYKFSKLEQSIQDNNYNSIDCSCSECSTACNKKPGWFLPGEAEKAAELLNNISMQDFFNKYLMVDWYNDNKEFVLSPAVIEGKAGMEFPGNPYGHCVFYDSNNNKCMIHDAKPFECREYMHDDTRETIRERHKAIADSWYNNKDANSQIRNLLGGRTPQSQIWHRFV